MVVRARTRLRKASGDSSHPTGFPIAHAPRPPRQLLPFVAEWCRVKGAKRRSEPLTRCQADTLLADGGGDGASEAAGRAASPLVRADRPRIGHAQTANRSVTYGTLRVHLWR